ncbi:MAG: TRAP transporter large permease subunit [Candidatus Dadabacteria bacterium]|nr:MAG: TRAP transporter large permease subunit [Candidatus Dadabacteria bacterium]
MSAEELLPLFMFIALFLTIMAGFPVAFSLAGTAFYFALIGYWLDIFSFTDFGFIPSKVFGIVKNFTLLAVPLFIFMGVMLEKSGIAEELLGTMDLLCRRIRGGLTIALVLVGALLAASTGIVGATVVTMGVLALPAMLARNYNKELACGTIAASGTLGQIIPPSIVLVLLGDMMNVAVADLFAAAVFPGLLLVLGYILYILIRCNINPELAPIPTEETSPKSSTLLLKVIKSLLPPFLLIFLVLGSILLGVASPTESAACGAAGATLLAVLKKKFSRTVLQDVADQTVRLTSMVFTLLIGAQFFSVVFRGLYGDDLITDLVLDAELNKHFALFFIMLLMFLLGFFLDFIEICFIVVPIIAPLLVNELGFNPLWLAILIAVNLQTSFLTPPFGFALFYLKGVAPPAVNTLHIYRGILPFVAIQIAVLVILAYFPEITLWLPKYLFGS